MLMTGIEVQPPEAQWLLFVPPALNSETQSLATQSTRVFCVIPPVNAADFCTQHYLSGLCNKYTVFSVRWGLNFMNCNRYSIPDGERSLKLHLRFVWQIKYLYL